MKTKNHLIPRERSNLIHFRFLGLKRGECRPHVIRSAAEDMSSVITSGEHQYRIDSIAKRRFEVALAAYRLLDPRRRTSVYERIQLGYPIEHDEEGAEVPTIQETFAVSSRPVRSSQERSSQEKSVAVSLPAVRLMEQPLIDRAIMDGESTHVAVASNNDQENWLEDRRDVVRTIRDAEESVARSKSPLDWLRSIMGLW